MRYFRFLFVLLTLSFTVTAFAEPVSRHYTSRKGIPNKAKMSLAELNAYVKKQLIILDAGHGGTDEGARVQTFQEKKITLTTTLMTKKQLEDLGYRVLLTRSRDIYLSLNRRVSIANETQNALFVSIHYNASQSKIAKGIEVFYPEAKEVWRTHASKRLANCILYHVLDHTEAISRGVKEGNFHVIRETQMPAVLIEGGFVTNAEERALLKDREYLARIAKGIAHGIDKYIRS